MCKQGKCDPETKRKVNRKKKPQDDSDSVISRQKLKNNYYKYAQGLKGKDYHNEVKKQEKLSREMKL